MHRLAGSEMPEQIEIEAIADQIRSGADRRLGLGGATTGVARPDADDRQAPARPAARCSVDEARTPGDGASGAPRALLGDDERRVQSGGGERRPFGDAPAAGGTERRLGARA